MENEIIKELTGKNITMGEIYNPVKVSIGQFYGIEINDFAVTVARTALWIAEAQMLAETEDIVHLTLDFLPLKSYANIVEGNALRMDWDSVIPRDKCCYIMGNPPFVGYSLQSKEQKADILATYLDEKGKPYKKAGKIDYVAGWYYKAAEFLQNTSIQAAFVSTNSITQGEQVADVWKPLFDRFGIQIQFAYRTFKWSSESNDKAAVHCVIVGFSCGEINKPKILFSADKGQEVTNINAYLVEAPTIFLEGRASPLCDVPEMVNGGKPTDGGYLFLTEDERQAVLTKEPQIETFIYRVYGADEYINNRKRFCLWLVDASPAELKKSPFINKRVQLVREYRLASPKPATKKSADAPALFQEIRQSTSDFIIVPRVSSENRRYIPLGFMTPDNKVTDSVQMIPNATLYHFGIIESNVHMAWMRAVAGRLEMRYRYSNKIVYNNFPWPTPTDKQKAAIEQTAQGILDARAKYPDASLADLYDEVTMPPELRRAHQANDRAVMAAYGFDVGSMTEAACVAALMGMYQELAGK